MTTMIMHITTNAVFNFSGRLRKSRIYEILNNTNFLELNYRQYVELYILCESVSMSRQAAT